jgi:hypothetical protein
MKCAQCGAEIAPGAVFCTSCGARQAPSAPAQPAAPPLAQTAGAAPVYSAPAETQAPSAPVPQPAKSSKSIGILIGIVLLLFIGAIIAVWLVFFPPGVYVQDSFRKVHDDLASQVKSTKAQINNGMLDTTPLNEKFDSFLYKQRTSDKSSIETTVVWKEGDENTIFGVICCALDENNFLVFMVTGKGNYLIDSYENRNWYRLTEFLKLPKDIQIERNKPYTLKIALEGDVVTAYLNDKMLATLTDAVEHSGRTGFYAQGGKTGRTVVAFDSFKAKKNSLFQGD